MVLEDLSKQNYVMKDTQLNLQESKILYAKLGRWHAASLCLSEKVQIEFNSLIFLYELLINL